MENETIIDLLKKKYNLNQAQIARILGVRHNTISNYALGKRQIKYHQLEKIANHFKIPITELLSINETNTQFESIKQKELQDNIIWSEISKKYPNSDSFKIIKLNNNSLSPHFQKGDNLIIDTKIKEFKVEGYYLVNFNNTDVICKIIPSTQGLLFKTNEADYSMFNPIIIGKVILSLREEE